jgi:hypothetical protein
MAITRLTQSTIQQAFPKYPNAWDGISAVGGMDALGSFTIVSSGSVSSITFSSIPQTYQHLQLRWVVQDGRSNGDGDTFIRFNGNSSSIYTYRRLSANGSASNLSQVIDNDRGYLGYSNGNYTTPRYSIGVADITDYSNANKTKTIKSLFSTNHNGETASNGDVSQIGWFRGMWNNTNAITSMTIITGYTFSQYTTFSLYGIK